MKRSFLVLAIFVFSVFFGVNKAGAVEVSGGASIDFLSDYVWRGITLTDGHGATQPSVSAAYGGLGFNYWASYDHDTSENNETDLTVSYGRSVGDLSIEGGYIYYDLDVPGADSHEIYGSLSYDTLLAPSVTYYHDIDLGDGGFLVLAIGHSVALPADIAVNLGASASVNFENAVMEIDGNGDGSPDDFTDFYNGELSLSVSIPLPVFSEVTLEPKLAYSFPLSRDAENAIEGLGVDPHGGGEVLYGGASIGFSF